MLDLLTPAFEHLGLKAKDRDTYLTCLRSPAGLHVQEIADATRIKRSTVNLALDRLERRGFIAHHIEGRRKVFTAVPPERVLARFEAALGDFKSLLPVLLATMQAPKRRARVRFFEGTEGLNQMFDDILLTARLERSPAKREILAISSGMDIFRVLPQHRRQFIEKRIREAIPTRWIAPDSAVAREYARQGKKEYRQMKFFNGEKYPFRIEMDVYGDALAAMSLEAKPAGVIIEEETIARSFRSLFHLLWDRLK